MDFVLKRSGENGHTRIKIKRNNKIYSNSNVAYTFTRLQRNAVDLTVIHNKGDMSFNSPTEINKFPWATCSKEQTPVGKYTGNKRKSVPISEGNNEHQ